MYFNTLGQFTVFLKLAGIGLLVGCVITLSYCIRALFGHKMWITIPLDILTTIIVIGVYFFSTVAFYDGIMHPFTIVGYLLGILLQQKTMGKLVAKVFNFLYNKVKLGCKRLFSTKVGKMLSK